MTFDQQLQRALDTFTARLRDEVDRQVRSVADEVAALARAEYATVEKAAAEAIERAEALERAAAEMSEKFAAESAEKAVAGHAAAEAASATGRLAAAIRALADSRSLSEVLDTLVSYAGAEARRAGVLIVRDGHVHGWRFVGFDASFDNAAAIDSLPSGQGSVNVPLTIGDVVVALLYADAGPEVGAANPERATLNAEPGTLNPEPGTLNPEPGTLNPEPGTRKPEPGMVNLESVEILARFASQRLEALTAMKAARSMTESGDAPAPSAGAGQNSADQHAAARRYARLLVSEIKLYHEPEVFEGRRERDLATRLGGEIARVRTLYEQRVPADVRQRTDYVHEELIRTLADGDASLLEAKT